MERSSSEEWRDVVGYEGIYHVSSHGRVRRVLASQGTRPGPLKPTRNVRNGYYSVMLWRDGKSKRITVHRLVALAFLGPAPEGLEVCHGDDDKSNNRVENLRWDTHSENHLDITRNGNRRAHYEKERQSIGENQSFG